MVPISIDETLKIKCPDLKLGCIQCDVIIEKEYPELLALIQKNITSIRRNLKMDEISKLPPIAVARKGYKLTGKDPARYRLSADSLLRRIVKGNDLYKINNVVDLLNLVSIQTGFSIGGYDVSKITGKATFGIGKENEPYEGIGRGMLNIHQMPVFRDDLSAFGSPTSDSARTMVSENTNTFLMVFFSFGGMGQLEKAMEMATDFLNRFASAENLEKKVSG
jgi:DNA/RNA-binding domain of Phe-tRNA-synthetase-like protein